MRILCLFLPLLLGAPALAQEASPEEAPVSAHDLLEAGFQHMKASNASANHYTYLVFAHNSEFDSSGRRIGQVSNEYDMIWFNDLPFLRLMATNGKALTGKALQHEQALYDRFVAEGSKLGLKERIELAHEHVVTFDFAEKSAVSENYVVSDTAIDSSPQGPLRRLTAVPKPGMAARGGCHFTYTFWVRESPATIFHWLVEAPADDGDLCRDARHEVWFSLVDGEPKVTQSEERYPIMEKSKRYIIRGEHTTTQYKRYRATVTIRPGEVVPPDGPPAESKTPVK